VEYALALKEKNKEARLLYSEGLLTDTPKDIIDGFECQRHLNSRVKHWCGHISLSYSPKDAERMSDEFMVKLALCNKQILFPQFSAVLIPHLRTAS